MSYKTIVVLIYAGFAVLEAVAGRFTQRRATGKDRIIEIASGFFLPLLVIPAVFSASSPRCWARRRRTPSITCRGG